MAVAILMLVFGGAFSLWGVINPRGVWKVTTSWSYKHPEANEPSDAGFAVQRGAYVFSLVVCVVLIIVLGNTMGRT